jgi:proteasome accessory factor C
MQNDNNKKIGSKISLLNLFSTIEKVDNSHLQYVKGNANIENILTELLECTTVGYHPYTPNELIDVEIGHKDVEVKMPLNLSKAVNLNIHEWLKLREVLEKKLENIDSSINQENLKNILKKINKIIPSIQFKNFSFIKNEIQNAISEKKVISFSYKKNSIKLEERKALPVFLFEETSHYLAALCLKSSSLRSFRLDRMVDFKVTDQILNYTQDEEQKNEFIKKFIEFKIESASSSNLAKILVHRSAYYNISRILVIQRLDQKVDGFDDYILVETKIMEENWFLDLIKGFGKSILILEPIFLKEKLLNNLNLITFPELKN